jgi:hypothetical protein
MMPQPFWTFLVLAGRAYGAQGRNRTSDTAIFSRMLYQLSYLGIFARRDRVPLRSGRLIGAASAAV